VKKGRACVGPTDCQPGDGVCPTISATTATSTVPDAIDTSATAAFTEKKKKGIGGGAIAAILIVLLVLVLGTIAFMVCRNRNNRNAIPVGLTVQNAAFHVRYPNPLYQSADGGGGGGADASAGAGVGTGGLSRGRAGSTLFSIPMEGDVDGDGGGAVLLVTAVNNTNNGGGAGGEGYTAPRNPGEPRKLYTIVGSAVEREAATNPMAANTGDAIDIYAHTEKPVDANNVYDPWGGGGATGGGAGGGGAGGEEPVDIYAHTEKPVDANNVYDLGGGGGGAASTTTSTMNGEAVQYEADPVATRNAPIEYATPLEDGPDEGNYAEMAEPEAEGGSGVGGVVEQSNV
jgi:hypothetical protein